MSTGGDAALIALKDHCIACQTCRPDLDRPHAERPECPEALVLYRIWRRAWRDEHVRAT